jgi:protein gp37
MRKPFAIAKPSVIFVNSMSDFFHENALDAWRMDALGVMAATPHQYQVLTKRPEHIAPFLARHDIPCFPQNVWIGASVERGDFNHRIETLRHIPATIRFLSVEPLIGDPGDMDLRGIHWVIAGGESGPGARPMTADWVRRVRDHCVTQDVPFFFKQWGQASNNPLFFDNATRWAALVASRGRDRAAGERLPTYPPDWWVQTFDANGKGGSAIDGHEWKQYPDFEMRGALI